MANFTTHIVVGTLVSGTLATLTLAADVIAPENLVAVTMAGSLGSVLPDIDLKDSRPVLLDEWKRRPLAMRLKESFARLWQYWL